MILQQDFKMPQPNQIKFTLYNSVQEEFFARFKHELLEYLKKQTGIQGLTISSEVAQGESAQTKPYTNREKLDHLAAQNPLVKELQQRLGLDPDF